MASITNILTTGQQCITFPSLPCVVSSESKQKTKLNLSTHGHLAIGVAREKAPQIGLHFNPRGAPSLRPPVICSRSSTFHHYLQYAPCSFGSRQILIRPLSHRFFSLFNRLTQDTGISPNEHTYGILINSCVRTNQVNQAFAVLGRLLREGVRADAAIFNSILNGLCGKNSISEAAAMVFEKMPKLGCVPNVVSYSILIKGLCSKGKTNLALQFLFEMIKHGGEFEPNVITYNTVIDGLCKEDDMHSLGVIPNTVTYNSLINGLCKKGALDKACELFLTMISEGYNRNVVTYTILIDGLCKNGKSDKAMDLLHVMASIGHEPNIVTYRTLINGLRKEGKIEMANDFLDEMIFKGYDPNMISRARSEI